MSESTGPNMGLKHGYNQGEGGWHTGQEANLMKLDTVVMLSVIDRDLTAPPGSPTAGDRYIVGASATGDWATKDKQIALYINSGWAFYVPKEGWLCYVQDEQKIVAYHSSAWSTGVSV